MRKIDTLNDFSKEEKEMFLSYGGTEDDIKWIKDNCWKDKWKKVSKYCNEKNEMNYGNARFGAKTAFVYVHKLGDKMYVGQTSAVNLQDRWFEGKGYANQPKCHVLLNRYGYFKKEVEHYIMKVPFYKVKICELYFIAKWDTIKNGLNTKFSI